MTSHVKRTTLVVRDLERAAGFYRSVLGFEVVFDNEITMSGSGYPAGKDGDRIRLAMMQGGDPTSGMIGLLHHLDPPLPKPPQRPVGIGDTVMVLQTDDLDRVEHNCEACGGRIFSSPHTFTLKGPGGKPVQTRSMTIFDPDGFILEINERPR